MSMHLRMKAKACVNCRQSKLRCDSDAKAPDACSRCQSLRKTCVFDRKFHGTSKSRKLRQLEEEVKRLRQATATSPLSDQLVPVQHQLQQSPSVSTPAHLSDKSLGNVQLVAGQVDELFRIFFIQYHIFLPVSIPRSPQTVYEKCPLLFWVICAIASSTRTMLQLQPGIEAMISQVVINPPRSVEVVQALLLLCLWPFPFGSTLSDPSFLYCGLATQLGLQIGLHRPTLSQEFSSRQQVLEVEDSVRQSTWVACYVVNQMQAGRLGVPFSIQPDYSLLRTLEAQELSPVLINLCRISRLTSQFTTIIGASAQNSSGLMDPIGRIEMVRFFGSELDALQRMHFPEMSQVIEISFLTSRLYLWSFLLHDDISNSHELIEFFHRAEKDAGALVQLASEKNLARSPFHLARAVLYSAVLLIKILASCYASQPQVIRDQIYLATRTLLSATKVEDDHMQRWAGHLQKLVSLHDKKKTPAIRSRMAASLMYDTIRVLKEHSNTELDGSVCGTDPGVAPVANWMDVPGGQGWVDLDGINWDDFGGLL